MLFVLFLFCRAPNNDYSPENLQTVNDVVYLNLFDEVVFNILQVRNQFCTTARFLNFTRLFNCLFFLGFYFLPQS